MNFFQKLVQLIQNLFKKPKTSPEIPPNPPEVLPKGLPAALQPPQPPIPEVKLPPIPEPIPTVADATSTEPKPVLEAPYTGPYFDINGKPDPLGQYDERTWKLEKERQAAVLANPDIGPVPYYDITQEEANYLLYLVETKSGEYPTTLFHLVLSGPQIEANRVTNMADLHRDYILAEKYTGRMVEIADRFKRKI